jgi:hypothetical protein
VRFFFKPEGVSSARSSLMNFCFPPLASPITGGARMMLVLVEHCVSGLHGSYPPEIDPQKFHLVAPYELDPDCWLDLPGSTNTRESMRSQRRASTAFEASHA